MIKILGPLLILATCIFSIIEHRNKNYLEAIYFILVTIALIIAIK